MSDSEDVLTDMMVVSAHGPSFNISNKITNFSSNGFSSTQMPRTFERQRSESEFEQSNSYRRRRASPVSFRSRGTTSSQISVVDIVDALRNESFSERDMKEISRAYRILKRNHRSKGPHRRRISWSIRDARVRRRSGYDSGGQTSKSSLSNSDDNSIKGSTYQKNMSNCRSTRTNISESRNTQNLIRSRFRPNVNAMVGINRNSKQKSVSSYRTNMRNSIPANFGNNARIYTPGTFYKDRFTNGVLLPSQRFQLSVPQMSILEQPKNVDTDSDIDDIFCDRSKKQTMFRTGSIDCVDKVSLPNQKKPCKNLIQTKAKGTEEKTVNNNKPNEFVSAKPIMPVRKTFNFISKEKLISKSVAPISETIEPVIIAPIEQNKLQTKACVEPITEPCVEKNKLPETNVDKDNEIEEEPANITAQTDISEKPNFRKQKLFSQKLDVADQKNVSTDKHEIDSPQNSGYSAILKEKHKVRKLQQAKTQSCMSRDVVQDNSNLLDSIYEIVPLDQMNVTNRSNKPPKANEQSQVTKEAGGINGDALSINTQKCVKLFWDSTDVESGAELLQPHRNEHTFNNNETHNNNRQEKLHSPETSVFRGFSPRFDSTKISNTESDFDRLKQFNGTVGVMTRRARKQKEQEITKDETLKPVIFEPKPVKQKTSTVQKKSDDKSELPNKNIQHQPKINEQIEKTLKPTSEQIKTRKGCKQNHQDAVTGQNKQNQSKSDKNIKNKTNNSKNSSLQEAPQNKSSTKVINKEQAENNSEVKNTRSCKKRATNTKQSSLMTPTKNDADSKITNKENVQTKANLLNKNSKTQPDKLKQSSDKKQSPDNKKYAQIQTKKLKDSNDNNSNKRKSPEKHIEENNTKTDRVIRSCRMRKMNFTK